MIPVTISQVEDLYQELSKNRKADQRKMLANIHEVCAKLVKQGSTPSAASVVKILGTQGYKSRLELFTTNVMAKILIPF